MKLSSPPKIVFLLNDSGSFIDRDREILQAIGEVNTFDLRKEPSRYQSFGNFLQKAREAQTIFVWFGSLEFLPYLALARLLRKRILVVCGGYDVAYAPEINHGAFTQTAFRKFLRRLLFRLAHRVFAVSTFNLSEARTHARIPKEKLRLIPLGFPPLLLPKILSSTERKDQVVMIAHLDSKSVKNKGLHYLIELARMNPDVQFCHHGRISDDVQRDHLSDKPMNLKLLGELPYRSNEFNQVLNESKIILQLSFYESFCASLIDGALAGCRPLAWSKAAMPETIESLGETVPYGDLQAMSQKIQAFLHQEWDTKALAEKAIQKFNIEKRKQRLQEELLSSGQQDY